jgi:hypothetical protein
MKNPMEVLRSKEQDLLKVRKEVEALRVAARLLSDDLPPMEDNKQDARQLIEMP